MEKSAYYFGSQLAHECDYFAFPRTGNHFLWHCFTGLFDLVFFPTQFTNKAEPIQRQEEIEPMVLQALKLRQDDAGFHPVHIRHDVTGVHGSPSDTGRPIIVMVRDPRATLYSLYHTSIDRWGANIPDPDRWLADQAAAYRDFYNLAWDIMARIPERFLLVRYEELRREPAVLQRIVDFVGVRPKLPPQFVHWCCQFERFARPGIRTFYRHGTNETWRDDPVWRQRLGDIGDFTRFGY